MQQHKNITNICRMPHFDCGYVLVSARVGSLAASRDVSYMLVS